ncbi:hypothetical protein JYU23_00340 [bacterium AH-315-C07]|nr:hypothetical protein [bacterium AH-315-C07]
MKVNIIKVFCVLFILSGFICLDSFGQHPQGMQTEFGKNRIQYKDFDWYYYRTEHFDTYFYLGGKRLAVHTSKYAEQVLDDIQQVLDYKLAGRINFILYNKLSDLKQTNIGISEESYNTGGMTKLVGNKAFIYFNGDHNELERQIKAGIARILINEMLYGGDIKEMMQNATLLSLPEWYIEGLVSFIADEWNVDIDNKMRDGITSEKYKRFSHVKEQDPAMAGHSVWYYVSKNYGYTALSNIVYMTRINRNIESGFLFVLGTTIKNLGDDWLEFYEKYYSEEDSTRGLPEVEPLPLRIKKERIYDQLVSAPDGKNIAYSTNQFGKYKVWLYNLETKKSKKIFKLGFKSMEQENDLSYPVLAWHPSGRLLAIVYEKESEVMLDIHRLEDQSITYIRMPSFDKILSVDYAVDARTLVLSAIRRGQTDIFTFNVSSRIIRQLTKDVYDDFDPHFIDNSSAIVFSSNRPNDSLRTIISLDSSGIQKNLDIFLFDLNKSPATNKVLRLTNTEHINETSPMQYDSSYISYISDENGIRNLRLGRRDSIVLWKNYQEVHIDTFITASVTNYPRNLLFYQRNQKQKELNQVFYKDGKYQLYSTKDRVLRLDKNIGKTQNTFTKFKKSQLRGLEKVSTPTDTVFLKSKILYQEVDQSEKMDSNYIDIDNYVFNPQKKEVTQINKGNKEVKQNNLIQTFSDTTVSYTREKGGKLKTRPYETAFSTNYIVTQLDNSNINSSYQKFTGGGPIYQNPGLNAFVKVGISDLFDDYKINGGFRLGGDLNDIEYFLSFENLKKRLDKQIYYYKDSHLDYTELDIYRVKTHDLRYILKWPFSERASIRFNSFLRFDKTIALSNNFFNLITPNQNGTWLGAKVEYVFDNTIYRSLNILNGVRLKFYLEGFKPFLTQYPTYLMGLLKRWPLYQADNSLLGVIGADIRHYQKLHRNIIWANRLATSYSFTDQKIIYYLGGVNNWLSPKFHSDIEIANDQNYAYQALVMNMRGFNQNIRNGNKVASVNSEIRFPFVSYLYTGPIKSDFLRNLQLIGFVDAGTAWIGKTPFDEGNSFNTKTIQRDPVKVTLTTIRNPIVYGYGTGLRSRLLGYFVRLDLAWGYEDSEVQAPLVYVSFSLDF